LISHKYLKNAIPVVETFAAWLAVGNDGADVSTSASITFLATHTGQADAGARCVVALLGGGSQWIAETWPTRVVGRITPVVGATLIAFSSTETFAAFALAVEFVTLGRK
jgi:hypothetical protein